MKSKPASSACLRNISRCLALILLMLATTACGDFTVTASLTPQEYSTPAKEISTYTTLTMVDPNDPTHAHWVDYFGWSMAIDGDVLVTGAPRWGRPPGEGAGAAHVYRRTADGGEWRYEAELTASDRDDGFQYDQHFGASIAMLDGLIAVGAPDYDSPQTGDNTGAVYLYSYDGKNWVETGKIIPANPVPGGKMGTAIACSNGVLAASGSPQAGSVNLFEQSGGQWREFTPVSVPLAADGQPSVRIALYGDTLAVSSVVRPQSMDQPNFDMTLLKTTGLVTLFQREGERWEQVSQTAPQEASLYIDPYGMPVALSGKDGKAQVLAVGKPGFAKTGRETGSVAIYERNQHGWNPKAELSLAAGGPIPGALPFFGHDPAPIFFGSYVNFEGNRLAVVSAFANTAYVFEKSTSGWNYSFRLTPGAGFGDDFQSRNIALNGSLLALGSPGELGGGNIFLFKLE